MNSDSMTARRTVTQTFKSGYKREVIDVSDADIIKLILKAYELSGPAGYGFLHYTPEPLSDDMINHILKSSEEVFQRVVEMDYVKGRSIKMHVYESTVDDEFSRDGVEKYIWSTNWYDHTSEQLEELLNYCIPK